MAKWDVFRWKVFREWRTQSPNWLRLWELRVHKRTDRRVWKRNCVITGRTRQARGQPKCSKHKSEAGLCSSQAEACESSIDGQFAKKRRVQWKTSPKQWSWYKQSQSAKELVRCVSCKTSSRNGEYKVNFVASVDWLRSGVKYLGSFFAFEMIRIDLY